VTTRRRSRLAAAAVGVLTALVAATFPVVAPAAAAANPAPISWKVYKTFMGPEGEDVPLRIGQHDAGPVQGFGKRHIDDGHAIDWDRFDGTIQRTLDRGRCRLTTTTVTCTYGAAFMSRVVFNLRVDSRSGDGRPKGIITAYEWCQVCRDAAAR